MDPTRLKKLAEERLTLLRRICCTFTLMLARRHIITHRVYRYDMVLHPFCRSGTSKLFISCVPKESNVWGLRWCRSQTKELGQQKPQQMLLVSQEFALKWIKWRGTPKMDRETLDTHHKCRKILVLSIPFGESFILPWIRATKFRISKNQEFILEPS